MKASTAIRTWLSSDNSTSFINREILWRPCDANAGREASRGWHDTRSVNLPDYLANALSANFRVKQDSLEEDLLMKHLFEDFRARADLSKGYAYFKKEFAKQRSTIYDVNSSKELSKAQVLLGAPIGHTPLTSGSHFIYVSTPEGFNSFDWSWVAEAAKWFRSYTDATRSTTSSLPASTSQGMWLKTSADSTEWRVISKVLQAAMAMRCSNHADTSKVISSMDKVFEENGYQPVGLGFMQGIRRQQMAKSEPIDPEVYVQDSGPGSYNVTNGIQGRIRGIFIPNEFLKARFKKLSDGLKTALFERTECCKVDPAHLQARLSAATILTQQLNQSSVFHSHSKMKDGDWLGFYDLDAFDTSTHSGFFDLYNTFLEYVFPDSAADENMRYFMGQASLFFPSSVNSGARIMEQSIKGRSTLSGQPDVTVKNNVVHILASTMAIAALRGLNPLDVFKMVLSGKNDSKDLLCAYHGDDAFVWLGDDPESYFQYQTHLKKMGLGLSWEKQPAYLKKLSSDANIVISRRGKGFVDYNGMRLDCIPGSILKNRFGEYATKDELLYLASASDTYNLLSPKSNKDLEMVNTMWSVFLNSIKDHSLVPKDPKVLTDGSFRAALQKALSEHVSSGEIKSRDIRGYVDRLYYAGGQHMTDDIESMYGQISYDIDKSMATYNLHNSDLETLIECCSELQHAIFMNSGRMTKDTYSKILIKYGIQIEIPEHLLKL